MRLRPSARALLFDEDDRVLLAEFDLIHRPLWAPPGGGVEDGETLLEALHRELAEEVGPVPGFDDATVPPHVWHRTVVVDDIVQGYDGVVEDYFLVRCAHFEPRGQLTDEQLRAENMVTLRWWTVEEIADAKATGTWFGPRHLDVLLADLLGDGPPPAPLLIGM